MNNYFLILIYVVGAFLLVESCTPDVEIDFPKSAPKLFVDASIERVEGVYNTEGVFGAGENIDRSNVRVLLSTTISPQSSISLEDFANNSIKDAQVTMVLDDIPYPLLLDSFNYYDNLEFNQTAPPSQALSNIYFYFFSASNNLPYELDKEYLLRVIYQGVTYEGTTIIPSTRKIVDSIFYEKDFFFDSTRWLEMFVATSDPIDEQNYFRNYISTNVSIRNSFYRFFPSVFRLGNSLSVDDDVFDNGESTVSNPIFKLANTAIGACLSEESIIGDDVDVFFDKYDQSSFRDQCTYRITLGDTVFYKISSISQTAYEYISSQETSTLNIGNPGQPIRVNTTFSSSSSSNEVLGTFIGYRSFVYKTIADTTKSSYIY